MRKYRYVIVLLTVVIVGSLVAGGYYYQTAPKTAAFAKLHTAYQAYMAYDATRDCRLGSPRCIDSVLPSIDTVLSPDEQSAIAKAYIKTKGDSQHLELQTIAWYNRYELDTANITHQSATSVKPTDWYWEVFDCDTSEAIYINAKTGQTSSPTGHLCGHTDLVKN